MSYALVEDLAYQIVKLVSPSLNTIIAYQNGPEPVTPYCVITCQSIDPVGREDTSSTAKVVGDTRKIRVVQNYLATVRFEFTGKDSTTNHGGNIALDFIQNLATPNIQLELRKRNLGFMQKSIIRRIPKLRETVWYNAYTVDIVFSIAIETVQQLDTIETVILDSTYHSITTIVDSQTIPTP